MSYFFILGAPDPEMAAVESVLHRYRQPFAYATLNGQRVYASEAYLADDMSQPLPATLQPVFVECAVQGLERQFVIDHHRAGDPGYACVPHDYWLGSSLGQLHALLRVPPTPDARIIAAADHCPTAAYRGECPDVLPSELRQWRISTRAERRGISFDEMERIVEASMQKLVRTKRVTVAGFQFADVTRSRIAELPEASAITGIPIMNVLREAGSGREKVSVLGASPDAIRAWMDWAQGFLCDVYGAPHRGYAGAYAP